MVIGIDASNIRGGGGITHLKAILEHADIENSGLGKIVIWASLDTLNKIKDYSFLEKHTHPYLNKSTFFTFLFQFLKLKKEAEKSNCNIMFVPGGTFVSRFKPFVTMSQNMLPFEEEEARQYNLVMRIRLKILFYTQSFTFKKANGLIFLTNYAKNYIVKKIDINLSDYTIIPHGVDASFQLAPRKQKDQSCYNNNNPFEFLYVSYITVYKHQWNIAEAICQLHEEGLPLKIKLIGSILDSYEKLEDVLKRYPNSKQCIELIPGLEHKKLSFHYHTADSFVFGSSCENMPIILIEAMSAGLPIASSDFGPMKEVLGDGGLYFNPKNVGEIKTALKLIFEDVNLRKDLARKAYNNTLNYTWSNCAQNTLGYLAKIKRDYNIQKICAE